MLTYELKKAPGVPLYEALYRAILSDPATKSGTRVVSFFGSTQVQTIEV